MRIKLGMVFKIHFINDGHGKQWHKTHNTFHAHGNCAAVVQLNNVVEELIFFIPQINTQATKICGGFRDQQELLKEFFRDALLEMAGV